MLENTIFPILILHVAILGTDYGVAHLVRAPCSTLYNTKNDSGTPRIGLLFYTDGAPRFNVFSMPACTKPYYSFYKTCEYVILNVLQNKCLYDIYWLVCIEQKLTIYIFVKLIKKKIYIFLIYTGLSKCQ